MVKIVVVSAVARCHGHLQRVRGTGGGGGGGIVLMVQRERRRGGGIVLMVQRERRRGGGYGVNGTEREKKGGACGVDGAERERVREKELHYLTVQRERKKYTTLQSCVTWFAMALRGRSDGSSPKGFVIWHAIISSG
jgi:hypothetical protein